MGVSIGITITQNSQDVSYNTSEVTVTATLYWTDGTWNNDKRYGELYIVQSTDSMRTSTGTALLQPAALSF